jgi:hypothetical protein
VATRYVSRNTAKDSEIGEWGEWMNVLHNQYVLPLRSEEIAMWNTMGEDERNRHVHNLRVKMMQKEVFYHQTPEGKIVLVDRKTATELGIFKQGKHGANKTNKRQTARKNN